MMSLKQKNMKRSAGDIVNGGFTIIETLVAIAILLLSIIGPLTIAEKGLASAEAARQEITAFYLAQEAIEYVRNIRDTNALQNGGQWLPNLDECLDASGCGIDITHPAQGQQIVSCNVIHNDDCALQQSTKIPTSASYGLFGHRTGPQWLDEWTESGFTRKVYITEIVEDVEASITVRVMWNTPSFGSRHLDLSEHLLNWYTSP